mgnify:CR=1 FL=1|jgi:hypothetical protein
MGNGTGHAAQGGKPLHSPHLLLDAPEFVFGSLALDDLGPQRCVGFGQLRGPFFDAFF